MALNNVLQSVNVFCSVVKNTRVQLLANENAANYKKSSVGQKTWSKEMDELDLSIFPHIRMVIRKYTVFRMIENYFGVHLILFLK
jgi:hypothetical protein